MHAWQRLAAAPWQNTRSSPLTTVSVEIPCRPTVANGRCRQQCRPAEIDRSQNKNAKQGFEAYWIYTSHNVWKQSQPLAQLRIHRHLSVWITRLPQNRACPENLMAHFTFFAVLCQQPHIESVSLSMWSAADANLLSKAWRLATRGKRKDSSCA